MRPEGRNRSACKWNVAFFFFFVFRADASPRLQHGTGVAFGETMVDIQGVHISRGFALHATVFPRRWSKSIAVEVVMGGDASVIGI